MSVEIWYLWVFATALFASIPLVLGAEHLGRARSLVDAPREGALQREIVPRTGGYGVFVAFWLAILVSFLVTPVQFERFSEDNERLLGVLLGSLILIPLAMMDDSRRLGPFPQLLGQIAAAVVPVLFGVRMDEIATPLGMVSIPDALAAPLAVLWIVAMINAINLIDGMDGLASGIASIAGFVLFLRSTWFNQASIAVLPLALTGSCLGFLTRNWFPARVFLGSSGALFVGYVLGAVTLIGGVKIGTAFLVLAIPILDVAWVMYRRISQGRSPFKGGDAEHLPHRLRSLGLRDPVITLLLLGVCALIGAAVLATHAALPTQEKGWVAATVVAAISVSLVAVARASIGRGSSVHPSKHEERPS